MGKVTDPINTPIVKLYNFDNRLVASSSFNSVGLLNPGIAVTSFKYTYDDENDDECIIRLQATHSRWIDYLSFNREDIINVAWGYVGGPISGKRSLVIRDIKSQYGPNIIYTELVCTDFGTYLKLTNSPFTAKMSPIDYIKTFCSGVINIVIKSSGDIIYKQNAYEKSGQANNEVNIAYIDPDEPLYSPPLKQPTGNYIQEETIYSSDVSVGTWGIGSKDPVRTFLEKVRDLNIVNKSPYTVLTEIMQLCPQGPWFITGRDNNILIHNRNMGSGPYRNYVYQGEPGDLIEFTPETKYEAFTKNTISQVGIDPVTKSTHFIESYLKVLDKIRDVKEIISDNRITDQQKSQELNEWLTVYNNGYQKFRTFRKGYKATAGGSVFYTDSFKDPYYEDKSVAKRDVVNVVNPLIRGADNPNMYMDPLTGILFGYQYCTPLTDLGEQTNIVQNAARKLEMEKEEASILVIGDPSLKNDMNVSVSGVQVHHVGTYYIKKCEHQISNMGYKTTMESFKVVDEAVLGIYSSVKDMQLDDEKKYKDEARIFRKWDIGMFISSWQIQSNITGWSKADIVNQKVGLSIQEYLRNNPDTEAKDLIELYNAGKVNFTETNEDNR